MTESVGGACRYELDAELRIQAVDDAWSEFAAANESPELVTPGPLGRHLFDYIQDATTVHLYRALFQRVRTTGKPIELPFRCDSAGLRRFLEMEICPGGSSGLVLQTRVLRLEPRAPSALLDRACPRSGDMVRMCSWCKAVETRSGWCEVEQAVVALRLFEHELLPTVTHGICPPCYGRVVGVLE